MHEPGRAGQAWAGTDRGRAGHLLKKSSAAANRASENPAPGLPSQPVRRGLRQPGVRGGSQLQAHTWGGPLVSGGAGLERRVRDIGGHVPASQVVDKQDQLFSKRESRSSLLFVGRSGGPR